MEDKEAPILIRLLAVFNFLAALAMIFIVLTGSITLDIIQSLFVIFFAIFNFTIGYLLWTGKKEGYLSELIQIIVLIIILIITKTLPPLETTSIILALTILLIYLLKNPDVKKFFFNNPNISIKEIYKENKKFLSEDTKTSLMAVLFIAFNLIILIIFPLLSFITGTPLPLVIVESCSMYHSASFEEIFSLSNLYEENGILIQDTKNWDFPKGFNKGDVIFVVGPKDIEVGDVIIFQGGIPTPIIHRVISIEEENGKKIYSTKGDNNLRQIKPSLENPTDETNIHEDQVIGKALFRIPAIGWIKLLFFEPMREQDQRGFCS